jgi:hypothetical protein
MNDYTRDNAEAHSLGCTQSDSLVALPVVQTDLERADAIIHLLDLLQYLLLSN